MFQKSGAVVHSHRQCVRSSFSASLPAFAVVTRGLVRHFSHRANSQEARERNSLGEASV